MKIAKNLFKLQDYIRLTQVFFFLMRIFFHQNALIGPKGNMKDDPPSENGKELQVPVSIEKQAAEGSGSSNSLKNISPPEGSVEKAQRARISPTESKSSHQEGQVG